LNPGTPTGLPPQGSAFGQARQPPLKWKNPKKYLKIFAEKLAKKAKIYISPA